MKNVYVSPDGEVTEEEVTKDEVYASLTDEQLEYGWTRINRAELGHYRTARALEYPPIGDQLDDLFKQGAFSDSMATKIQAVKDANPKPVIE